MALDGLERLSRLSTIFVNQLVSSYKGNNYAIVGDGEILFNVIEESHGWISSNRMKPLHGVDRYRRELFSAVHEGYFTSKVGLYIGGVLVSMVGHGAAFTGPVFNIYDAQKCQILRLKAKLCDNNTSKFKLKTNTKATIGSVQKKSRGWRKEMFSFKDDYVITFPANLVVPIKLAVIVATVIIDYNFHDRINNS